MTKLSMKYNACKFDDDSLENDKVWKPPPLITTIIVIAFVLSLIFVSYPKNENKTTEAWSSFSRTAEFNATTTNVTYTFIFPERLVNASLKYYPVSENLNITAYADINGTVSYFNKETSGSYGNITFSSSDIKRDYIPETTYCNIILNTSEKPDHSVFYVLKIDYTYDVPFSG